MPDPDRYLTPPQVAAKFGCKPETVISWIRSGELRCLNLARHGSLKPRYRIPVDALADFERVRTVVPREPVVRTKPNPDVKRFV